MRRIEMLVQAPAVEAEPKEEAAEGEEGAKAMDTAEEGEPAKAEENGGDEDTPMEEAGAPAEGSGSAGHRLFVGCVPPQFSEDQLKTHFEEVCSGSCHCNPRRVCHHICTLVFHSTRLLIWALDVPALSSNPGLPRLHWFQYSCKPISICWLVHHHIPAVIKYIDHAHTQPPSWPSSVA